MFINRGYLLSVLSLFLLFSSCFSTPSKKINVDVIAIEEALIEELSNSTIIIWNKGVLFADLDISDEYTFIGISDTTISQKQYDSIFTANFSFTNRDGDIREITITREFLIATENETFRGVQVGPVIFFNDDLIISIANTNNLPWIYYGRDSGNMYGREAIDTRLPSSDIFLVKKNQSLTTFHERVIAQNNSRTNNQQNDNVNKLLALLLNPIAAGRFGQFTRGEIVITPQYFLRVIDSQNSDANIAYLVAVNDNNVQKPFYIITDKRLNIVNIQYPNTIQQSLQLEFIGNENYSFNGIPYETFMFKY